MTKKFLFYLIFLLLAFYSQWVLGQISFTSTFPLSTAPLVVCGAALPLLIRLFASLILREWVIAKVQYQYKRIGNEQRQYDDRCRLYLPWWLCTCYGQKTLERI